MKESNIRKNVRQDTSYLLCAVVFLVLTGIVTGQAGAYTTEYSVNSTGYWEEGSSFVTTAYPINAACNAAVVEGARVTVRETGIYNDTVSITGETQAELTLDLGGATLQNTAGIAISITNSNGFTAQNGTISGYQTGISLTGTVSGCTLEDLTITGTAQDAIRTDGTTNFLTATDLTITTPGWNGIYVYKPLTDALFENVTVTDPGRAGFTHYNTYVILDNVTFRNWTVTTPGEAGGINIQDGKSSIPIKGITLERVNVTGSAGPGITLMQNYNAASGDVVITRCRAENNKGTGMQITWRGTAVFDDITATGNGGYGLTLTAVPDSAEMPKIGTWDVSGNTGGGLSLTGFHDMTFTPAGQRIQDNGAIQMNLANAENMTIRDYVFTSAVKTYTNAVYLSGTSDGIHISNITAVSPTGGAIKNYGNTRNLTATDLTITTPGENGIYVYKPLTDALFENVTVTDPVRAGFTHYNTFGILDNVTFKNWTVTTPGGAGGINIQDGSSSTPIKGITLDRVNVTGSAGPGITLMQNTNAASGDVVITRCRAEKNQGTGMQITWRGTAVFDDITATGNGNYGLTLTAVPDSAQMPEIGTWNVSGNTGGGLSLTGFHDMTFTPAGQRIQDNGAIQMNIVNAENMTVRDYVFTSAVKTYTNAMYLSGTSDGIHISNITAVSSTGDAIITDGTTGSLTATDLTITTPGWNGIYVYKTLTDALFENVTVTDPGRAGFTHYNTYGILDNVTFRNWTVTTPGGVGGINIQDGKSSTSSTPIKGITLDRVNVTGSAGPGIYLMQSNNAASGGCTLSGVTVTDAAGNGVELHYRGTAIMTNPTITGCDNKDSEGGIFAHGYGTHALSITGADLSGNYYGIHLENASNAFLNDSLVLESTIGGLYADADCTGMAAYNLSFNATATTGIDAIPYGGIVLGDAWSEQTTPYPGTGIYAGVWPLSVTSAVNITIPVSGSSDPADLRLFVTHADADWTVLPAPNTATVTGPASADVFAAVSPASLPATGTWYTLTPLVLPVCATGYINVTSVPEGGWVWLDGTNMSVQTNARLPDIPVGTHTVTVCKEGYPDATNTSVQVLSRETTTVGFTLDNQWEIPLLAGWNMISMPATGTPVTWPAEVTTSCYRYDGSDYDKADRDALEPGTGYWIACTAPCTLVIEGAVVPAYTIGGSFGWNLIGATGDIHPTGDITTSPADLVTGPIYAYNGATYMPVTDITPGAGYWAALTGDGTITLG